VAVCARRVRFVAALFFTVNISWRAFVHFTGLKVDLGVDLFEESATGGERRGKKVWVKYINRYEREGRQFANATHRS
jgi:hypothetical protein